MADTQQMREAMTQAAQAYGDGFTCYTERDGGPWYLIAGYRESWHGAERVADSDTSDRDAMRAFALFLMGQQTPAYAFAETRRAMADNSGFLEFTGIGGACFTVWARAAERAFPAWHEAAGLPPAYYVERGEGGALELRRECYRTRRANGNPHPNDPAASAPDRAALVALIGDQIRERIDWSGAD